jgi:hypothetical protein
VRRLLLFLLLLAVGFAVLHFAVADDRPATAGTAPSVERQVPQGQPIRLQGGTSGMTASISGPLKIVQTRLVPTADGKRKEPVYTLESADTVPQPDGTYLLQKVTVQLFDAGAKTADLLATQAIVALQNDSTGTPSIREDKDLEFTGFQLDSVPGAKTGQFHMECEHARARISDEEIALRTADEREPVTIRVGGDDRSATLHGRGMSAHMPKDRSRQQPGSFEFEILHAPELTSEGLTVHAQGTMHYTEDLASGRALLTLVQNVVADIESVPAGVGTTGGGSMQVTGDRLTVSMQHARTGGTAQAAAGHGTIAWQLVQLTGAPARVTGNNIRLESKKLSVQPGPTGKPALLTAHGGPSELRQTDEHGEAAFASPRPIRMVRPREAIGAVYERFGFPAWSLRPYSELQVLVFDGDSRLDNSDGVRVQAEGLHVFQWPAGATGPTVVAVGRGSFAIEQGGAGGEHTVATGDDGFRLQRDGTGDKLTLGRDDPAAAQQFSLKRGTVNPLNLHGTGACTIEHAADGTVTVHARSTGDTIAGQFGSDLGTLDHASAVDLVASGGSVQSFRTSGSKTHLLFARGGAQYDAWAQTVEQTGRASWQLSRGTAPAHLHRRAGGRDAPGDLTAARIDLHLVGARALLLDSFGDDAEPAHLTTTFAQGRQPRGNAAGAAGAAGPDADLHIDVSARRLRLLPFALPGAARAAHFQGLSPVLAQAMDHVLGSGWLLADGQVVTDLADERHGTTRGSGTALIMSQGVGGGVLVGDPAAFVPATLDNEDPSGRHTKSTGARVRFGKDGRVEVLTRFANLASEMSTEVTIRDPHGGSGPFANMRAVSQDEIHIAPDSVVFLGPVTAYSLLADGLEDPRGMHVTAKHLSLAVDAESHEVTRADMAGGVDLQWKELRAHTARVELDLKRNQLIATDPVGAEVWMRGRRYWGRQLLANYQTYSLRSWFGGVEQQQEAAARR